jgi:uncharacterized SAM-binding protein YcdF (DUF218 family)
VWVGISLGLGIAIHTYGYEDHAQESDVIVVLGAGLRRDNRPTLPQRNRVRHAAELWKAGVAPYILCTGGTPFYATRSEADACRELLVEEHGVPADRVILEERSRSTEENALYSREIMEARGWETAVVVSERYHLFRANYLFQSLGMNALTSPASVSNVGPLRYASSLAREVVAYEWQLLSDLLNLPFTYVPLV